MKKLLPQQKNRQQGSAFLLASMFLFVITILTFTLAENVIFDAKMMGNMSVEEAERHLIDRYRVQKIQFEFAECGIQKTLAIPFLSPEVHLKLISCTPKDK